MDERDKELVKLRFSAMFREMGFEEMRDLNEATVWELRRKDVRYTATLTWRNYSRALYQLSLEQLSHGKLTTGLLYTKVAWEGQALEVCKMVKYILQNAEL